jgi:hypothetical protein
MHQAVVAQQEPVEPFEVDSRCPCANELANNRVSSLLEPVAGTFFNENHKSI